MDSQKISDRIVKRFFNSLQSGYWGTIESDWFNPDFSDGFELEPGEQCREIEWADNLRKLLKDAIEKELNK